MRHIFIDTNVLLLLLIGRWDRDKISTFRRTREFSAADYDMLETTLRGYASVIITAPVLTEVSNLMGNAFHEKIAETIRNVCGSFVERQLSKQQVLADVAFERLGFADASVLAALDIGQVVLLTDDVHLYLAALDRHFEAINMNHIRALRY